MNEPQRTGKCMQFLQKIHLFLWTTMRLAMLPLLIVMTFSGIALALETSAQDALQKKISLQVNDGTIDDILRRIEHATDVKFIYSPQVIQVEQKVSIKARNERLRDVLNDIFSPLRITYEVVGKQIMLKKANTGMLPGEITSPAMPIEPAAISITGRVSDDQGTGLPGVNVLVKGTTIGTATDTEGNYSLSVPDENTNGILVFSFIGYISKETPINNRTRIDVTLLPDVQSLSEVVVIGYGQRERKDLTGSIGSVSTSQISSTPIVSPDQALQGRVSGVNVTSGNGDPSARQVIRIRGVGTLGSNDPLIVVDGVPLAEVGITGGGNSNFENVRYNQNPLSLINPNDIESIDVLKDASAAAIYGVRAANGVIIITTKKGKTGKTSLNFDAYRGIQQVRKTYDVLNGPGYLSLLNEIFTNAGENLPTVDKAFDPANPDNLLSNNVDWQKEAYNKNAPIENYNLSFTAGSEKYNLFLSGGYFRQEAIIKERELDRFSFGLNSNVRPLKFLNVGQTLRLGYSRQNLAGTANNFGFGTLSGNAPVQLIFNPSGPNGFQPSNATTGGLGYRRNIPGVISLIDSDLNILRTIGSVFAEVTPFTGLQIRGNIGIDFEYGRSLNFGLNDQDFQPGASQANRNGGSEGSREALNLLKEITATYSRSFGEHNFSLLAGAMNQQFTFTSLSSSANNFPGNVKELRIVNLGTDISTETIKYAWSLQGYIGRLSYNFKNKYYLDATIRRDGSSRFAPKYRWGVFPSFSAAWRFSDESFMKGLSFLTEGKLRLGWGQLGNQDTQPYAYLSLVNLNPQYHFGDRLVKGAGLGQFPIENLSWETSTQTNIGLDLGFFDNKLTATIDYYIKDTKDILISVPLPQTSGFSNTVLNSVAVQNKGIELALGYNGTVKNFNYGISGNLTTVRNRVTDLGERGAPITINNNRTELGKPVGYFYGYQTNGIFQNQAEVDAYTIDDKISASADPGDIRFVDNNGPKPEGSARDVYFSGQTDGAVDANDRTFLGKAIPDFYYGLTLTGGYKNFDLSLFFQGVQGVELYNQVRVGGEQMSASNNQWASTADRWRREGTSTTMPRAVRADPNQNNRFSDRWIENASFLRAKNIQIGYSLPQSLISKFAGMSSFRVYLSAQNLFVLTKYTGLDPEYSGSNVLENGIDSGATPLPRMYLIGVNMNF